MSKSIVACNDFVIFTLTNVSSGMFKEEDKNNIGTVKSVGPSVVGVNIDDIIVLRPVTYSSIEVDNVKYNFAKSSDIVGVLK